MEKVFQKDGKLKGKNLSQKNVLGVLAAKFRIGSEFHVSTAGTCVLMRNQQIKVIIVFWSRKIAGKYITHNGNYV